MGTKKRKRRKGWVGEGQREREEEKGNRENKTQ